VYRVLPQHYFPREMQQRIEHLQPITGILGHICLKAPLETKWPKGVFLADLPGPQVRGGQPIFSYEQTSEIDPVRVINGNNTIVQSWLALWCRDPDEAHDRELVEALVDAQLAFLRRQYPEFDDLLDWYMFVIADRVYGVAPTPGFIGDRRPTVHHPTIRNLFFTGTEARPKGCYHTFNTYRASLQHLVKALGATEQDVAFMPSPLAHAVGMVFGLGVPLLSGSSTHLLDVWDPAVGLRRIQEYGCTSTATPTVFLQMALDAFDPARHDLSSLRVWTCGGAPIPSSMVDRMARVWPQCRLLSLYGRSEVFVSTVCSIDDPVEWSSSSDGHPPPWVELGILDSEGRALPPGAEGEIVQRGPGTMLGYWNNPDRTADAFDQQGWAHSGDLGRIDDQGCLRVTGRLKDIIIRGGVNISAREVEDHLMAHPNVKDAAVVAMPDKVLGERACAFIVSVGPPPTLEDLTTFLRVERRISAIKLPERLEIVDALPFTASGKVQKFQLRERVRRMLEEEELARGMLSVT